MSQLDGKTAVITGAAAGIGLAAVRLFASEVAAAALFLASDASCYVTGAELVVDGGMTQV